MKKLFSMMAAFAVMFSFAACGGDEPTETPAPQPSDKTQLDKPVVTVTSTGEDCFTISWEAVAGAKEYLVYLDKNNQPKTTETTYTFSNLNAGTYKPRVKAIGDGTVKDSGYSDVVEIVLTGVSSIDWFTQTLKLAEVNEEEGYAPYNAVDIHWQGAGVTELFYGVYEASYLAEATNAEIIDALTGTMDAESLAVINTPEGAKFTCGNLSGGVAYDFFVYVTNDKGVKFLVKDQITTAVAEPSEATQKWLGSWTVNSTKAYSVDEYVNITKFDKEDTFTVTVYNSADDPNLVVIDGLSVLGAEQGLVTLGEVFDNKLYIFSGVSLGTNSDGSIYNYWIGWYTDANGEFFPSIDGYPSALVTMDESAAAATSTNVIPMQDENGNPVELVCEFCDVFGVSGEGGIYFFIEAFPAVYRTGDMTWTKNAAAASALSVAPKTFDANMLKSSVVIAR